MLTDVSKVNILILSDIDKIFLKQKKDIKKILFKEKKLIWSKTNKSSKSIVSQGKKGCLQMLEKFLNNLKKEKCDDNCPFKLKNDRPIIKIPPPKKPLMMIISNDPTVNFIPLFKQSENYNQETQRLMLFSGAIPQRFLLRINQFLVKTNSEYSIEDFFKLFDIAYWTHFNKCPTDAQNTFKNYCANNWLEAEINEAISNGVKVIITLGRQVENWIKGKIAENIEIINFYHPSGKVTKWNDDNFKSDLNKTITKLLEQIILLTKE